MGTPDHDSEKLGITYLHCNIKSSRKCMLNCSSKSDYSICAQNENHKGTVQRVVNFSMMCTTITEEKSPKYLRAELNLLTILKSRQDSLSPTS